MVSSLKQAAATFHFDKKLCLQDAEKMKVV
jgi:hypothetical protein